MGEADLGPSWMSGVVGFSLTVREGKLVRRSCIVSLFERIIEALFFNLFYMTVIR